MTHIVVMGAGSWGSAIATALMRAKQKNSKAKQVTEDVLLKLQRADGSWDGHDGMERGAGRIYCTALAMLSLSVKYHYLPIYQH